MRACRSLKVGLPPRRRWTFKGLKLSLLAPRAISSRLFFRPPQPSTPPIWFQVGNNKELARNLLLLLANEALRQATARAIQLRGCDRRRQESRQRDPDR